jgi:hypothetical protein
MLRSQTGFPPLPGADEETEIFDSNHITIRSSDAPAFKPADSPTAARDGLCMTTIPGFMVSGDSGQDDTVRHGISVPDALDFLEYANTIDSEQSQGLKGVDWNDDHYLTRYGSLSQFESVGTTSEVDEELRVGLGPVLGSETIASGEWWCIERPSQREVDYLTLLMAQ